MIDGSGANGQVLGVNLTASSLTVLLQASCGQPQKAGRFLSVTAPRTGPWSAHLAGWLADRQRRPE